MTLHVNRLRVTEIFYSLQGETRTVGLPTVFIRLTGCPLRCHYCDTAYAFHGGDWHDIDDILEKVKSYQAQYVTVTGGEPLAQKATNVLLTRLCDLNVEVSLETSGAICIKNVDSRVIKVLDIKTPGSGESHKNIWQNIDFLLPHDQLKFVICDRDDYDWSKEIIFRYALQRRCHILFSPSYHQIKASDIADWMLEDKLSVRLQIQLHKYLWGDVVGK